MMTRRRRRLQGLLGFVLVSTVSAVSLGARIATAQVPCDPIQTPPIFGGQVPTSEAVLGFALGSQEVTSEESDTYLLAVDAASDRVVSGIAAESQKRRPIRYALVGESENVTEEGLADIKAAVAALRDPATTAEEAAELAAATPAILWVIGNLHGGEESGADASLKILYELADREDCAAQRIRDEGIVVIIPVQNPDGREQDLRRNVYGFDLNRDWFARTQPETDGKVELMRELPPVLVDDVHEMGSDTYFFPPNADPVYHEITDQSLDWINNIYGVALADEFNRQAIPFFNFSPYDFFAVIFGDTVPSEGFLGAGMTFEKHNGDPIEQRTYEHYVAIWISLSHAAINKDAILEGWHQAHAEALEQGMAGELEPNEVFEPGHSVFQPVPTDPVRHYFLMNDPAKSSEVQLIVRRLQRMDVEVHQLTEPLDVSDFRAYGRPAAATTLPAGTYWIPMAQTQKHWIQAMLHEDTYIPWPVTYDVSAWSSPLLANIDGGFSGLELEPEAAPVPLLPDPPPPELPADVPVVALYQIPRSTVGFESAGWARYLFEQVWELPYLKVKSDEIRTGALDEVDVLVVADGYTPYATKELGQDGKQAIIRWVNEGGRFVGWGGGAKLATGYGISTARLRSPSNDIPGSLIRAQVDPSSPLAEGVGPFVYPMYEADLLMSTRLGDTPVVYPPFGSPDFFVSGLDEEADEVAGTAYVTDEAVGSGRAVLFAGDPNFRAWTQGTQRLLWNAIIGPDPSVGAAPAAGSAERAAAERGAIRATAALPDVESPITVSVGPGDAGRAAAILERFGARFVEQRFAAKVKFLVTNPGALTADEHPFALDLVRALVGSGIDLIAFHMS